MAVSLLGILLSFYEDTLKPGEFCSDWLFQLFSISNNLTDLMKSLQNINLIAKDTKVSNFKKVFSGNKIENPVVWTVGVVDLFYFIQTLHNTKEG